MPHRVLHILETARPEGAGIARIVAGLAAGIDPEYYQIHAWFLSDGPLAAELETAGAKVRIVKWRGSLGDPLGAMHFWCLLVGKRFDIVHQHFGGRAIRQLAHSAIRTKIALHLHGYVLETHSPEPVPILTSNADVVIAASHAVAKQVVGLQPHVVYAGVNVPTCGESSATARARKEPVIGTACRLVSVKGLVYLIRALALLRLEIPNVRLEIAGSGPLRSMLESEVQSLRLGDSVVFLGWKQDLAPVMAGWDIFVQPSLAESFGIATLEAMAAGLPVVATAVGGVPELVEDGRTGWLVPPGDSQALANRLRQLLLDPQQRIAMGTAGRHRSRDHFSVDRMVTEISKIYKSILEPSVLPKK